MTDANLIADEDFWKGVAGITGVVATLLGVAIALIDRSSKNRVAQHEAEKAALGNQLTQKDIEITSLNNQLVAAVTSNAINQQMHQLQLLQHQLNSQTKNAPTLEEITEKIIRTGTAGLQSVPASAGQMSIESVKATVQQFDQLRAETVPVIEPEIRSAIATNALLDRDYEFAAQQFQKVATTGGNWRAYFAQGISLANQRGGAETDLAAARAYGEAIALAPNDLPQDTRSKLFVYRGAMFKRLGRLLEAEADLSIGLELAQSARAKLDAQYNLSGVLAQIGKEEEALELLQEVCKDSGYRSAVASHRKDYYARLANNYRFISLLGSAGHNP